VLRLRPRVVVAGLLRARFRIPSIGTSLGTAAFTASAATAPPAPTTTATLAAPISAITTITTIVALRTIVARAFGSLLRGNLRLRRGWLLWFLLWALRLLLPALVAMLLL
jgi:hypothetical protein